MKMKINRTQLVSVLIIVFGLTAGGWNAWSEGDWNPDPKNPKFPVPGCPKHSKGPKCWETQPDKRRLFPRACGPLYYCTRVESVRMGEEGRAICEGDGEFDCTQLVKKYGPHLEGTKVLVKIFREDGCHVPGACGSRSCMKWGATAIFSPACLD
jgi:hypothetical protein